MAECSGYSGPAFYSIAKIRVKGSSDDRQTDGGCNYGDRESKTGTQLNATKLSQIAIFFIKFCFEYGPRFGHIEELLFGAFEYTRFQSAGT